MNVSLTETLEKLIQSKVESGLYTSASEVVREALRLLEERDRMRVSQISDLRERIAEGLRDIDDGRVRSYSNAELNQLAEDIKSEGRRRLDGSEHRDD